LAHDYIVVGAGAAGCAAAAGLVREHDASVLLLEAGPRDRDPRLHVPAAAADVWFGRHDWAYETEPQPGLGDRSDIWPSGRVLGGSSSINAMMYVRGMDIDFDEWETVGAPGWGAEEMTAAFRRIEDDVRGPASHRGAGGPVRVERQRDPSPLTEAFLDACEEFGIPRVEDYHAEPDGCGLTMVTQRSGRRWSAVDAFISPLLRERDPRLRLRTGAHVVRVVVEGGRAIGVEVLVDGRVRFARADREVVLAAGTVASPQLLLRSGIGPADHLGEMGVEVVADLPGVGENLQDHVMSGVVARTDGGSLYGADRDARAVARYVRHRRGPLTSNLAEAIAFIRTRADEPAPDVELIALPVAMIDHGRTRFPEHGLTMAAIVLRPASRGRIRLASSDPTAPPRIEPGTLDDPDGSDLRRLLEGVRWCQRLVMDSAALGRRATGLIEPPLPIDDEGDLIAHVRRTTQTNYHPVGTCRIGDDEAAVVDPRLRVHGIDGLRVADASVMPTLIRGHTHAAAMAIGDRLAHEMIDRT
jgi:choline dehydrogenase